MSHLPTHHIKDIPFIHLGRGDSGALLINVILPTRETIKTLTCEVFTTEGTLYTQTVSYQDELVRLYSFSFSNLKDGVTYQYRLHSNEADLELGEGLKPEDLKFTYWQKLKGAGEVFLLSCNGIFDYKGEEKNRLRTWNRLQKECLLRKSKLIILGGDQYYQDALETWIPKLKGDGFEKNRVACKKASLANALSYMSHESYRKIMAQIPSFAMLDDHDITDGAGGRAEFFIGTEFSEEWSRFASIQRELFQLLQASRNPSPVIKKKDSAFSSILDLGDSAIVALDMRTEKNSQKKLLMEEDSKEALFKAICDLPHKNVFLVLPVVPVRNSMHFEKTLSVAITIADFLSKIPFIAKRFPKAVEGLKHLTGCSDDLNDSLTSECNKDFFAELLKVLSDGSRRGVNYAFLSGDIHTGGAVEIFAKVNDHQFRIPLLISSPIGYDPMPELVEPVLRELKEIEFEHAGVTLAAVTGRFSTQRNFMYIELNRLFTNPNEAVFIYEERISGRRRVLVQDWENEDHRPLRVEKRGRSKDSEGPGAEV